jgi:nucleoside 2-deoxyribosyltransferase
MRHLRVCMYGSTDLGGTPTEFISKLAYKILDSMEAVIVTGGFHHSHQSPHATSTDVAALIGARRYAEDHGVPLKECYEAWIPDPTLDDRPDIKGAVRLTEEEGVTLRIMSGRTPLGRRLAMVAGVDMVVTISGKVHTEVVVEQAVELGIPVLPIPFAGGDSEALLNKYYKRIAAAFEDGALDTCVDELNRWTTTDLEKGAAAVIDLIRTAKVGKCLVLLPYDDEHKLLYKSTIEPAIAKHMIPVRLDHLPRSEAIYTSFADAIRSCSAVVADITMLNENVMYEIGYAHGHGLTPLIYTRDEARLDQLPVYFRTLNVRLASRETPAEELIDEYLTSLKDTRRLHQRAMS